MTSVDFLTSEVPNPEAAKRFLHQLVETHPSVAESLKKNDALLSDVLMLVSCSQLFAASLLREPDYVSWLGRERTDTHVRDKQTILESLARFSLTHSQVEPHILLARFRRRELMRLFLRDVRHLATIAEITEEISNVADAILEHALRLSEQELDNRFGKPQETDERGRLLPAQICIVSLGKLGSRELNYSSDIDLLFIYSHEGKTSGSGNGVAVTNLEYFSKLTEAVIKLVSGQGGEGAAYRIDMRLRPHGRVGPLALPLGDMIRYYRKEAAAWERQVLIRSRSSAGSDEIFRKFSEAVENKVFSKNETVENALRNVSLSKQ
jgi:[glutamine synthetase] adenylyltransferase / [glutamine synthetase]-adenylyl-L-tyrosine phosphorylase